MFCQEEKSQGGGEAVTKGLMEVEEEKSRADRTPARVWLPSNHPQPLLPVALVTVNGGALATVYL